MYRILLVCTGNTCRSPMAAVLLQDRITTVGLTDKFLVASMGLSVGLSAPASYYTQQVMREKGLDLSSHIACQVTPEKLSSFDLILTMTKNQKLTLKQLAPAYSEKMFFLTEFVGQAGDVKDPYGGNLDTYASCAQQLAKLVDLAWQKIFQKAGYNGKISEQND